MPRKKQNEFREQPYDVGDEVTVIVRYRADKRPKMLHDDRVVIIGEHRCGATSPVTDTIPSELEIGPSRSQILEFQRQRETPPPRRIFTSEDAARQSGMAVDVSFEALSRVAEAMPSTEDSVIE